MDAAQLVLTSTIAGIGLLAVRVVLTTAGRAGDGIATAFVTVAQASAAPRALAATRGQAPSMWAFWTGQDHGAVDGDVPGGSRPLPPGARGFVVPLTRIEPRPTTLHRQ